MQTQNNKENLVDSSNQNQIRKRFKNTIDNNKNNGADSIANTSLIINQSNSSFSSNQTFICKFNTTESDQQQRNGSNENDKTFYLDDNYFTDSDDIKRIESENDDEFYDALSQFEFDSQPPACCSLCSNNQEDHPDQDNFSLDSFDNQFKFNEIKNSQIEKFKIRENQLTNNKLLSSNAVITNTDLIDSNLDENDLKLIDYLSKNDKNNSNKTSIIQSILNKKLRDELTDLRAKYQTSVSNNSFDMKSFMNENELNNKASTFDENDLLLRKFLRQYSQHNNQMNSSTSHYNNTKYHTFSASTSKFSNRSTFQKIDEITKLSINNQNESLISDFGDSKSPNHDHNKSIVESKNLDKFKTWPVDLELDQDLPVNESIDMANESHCNDQSDLLRIKKSASSTTNNANLNLNFSPTKSQTCTNIDEVETPDEFINPVDKQIMFHMTSNSLNNSSKHHHGHHGHHTSHHHHYANLSKDNVNENEISTISSNNNINNNNNNKANSKRNSRNLSSDSNSNSISDIEPTEEYLDLNYSNYEEEDDDERDDIGNYEVGIDENEINRDDVKSFNNSSTKKNFNRSNIFETSSMDRTRLSIKKKTTNRIRKVFNRFGKAVKHVQNKAEEVLTNDKENSSESDSDDIMNINESSKTVKYKASRSNKSSNDFDKTQIIQILNPTSSSQAVQSSSFLSSQISTSTTTSSSTNNQPSHQLLTHANTPNNIPQSNKQNHSNCIIWAMKFSPCGKLLATAGKDQILRCWILRSYIENFIDLIKKHNNNQIPDSISNLLNPKLNSCSFETQAPFYPKPFLTFKGHSADILDVSWSKNLFILTASSDKTCRLWHTYKSDCLCVFHHSSIVSSISFHPKDDRYFISACLDCKLRLWNISEKKVVLWNDLNNLNQSNTNFITAINFCQGGKMIAVGTFDGKCILYHTEHFKYYSLINVRSTRGRNSKGSKITGIEVMNNDENKILITSNDSRIRLYDLRDLSLVCKYKGFSNSTVHIRASFSPDDKFIISGSKNKCTYIWKTNHQFSMLTSGRRDRNNYWERIQAHNAIVTCAVFSPKPQIILNQINNNSSSNVASTTSAVTNSPNKNTSENTNFKDSNQKSPTNKDKKTSHQGVHVFVSAAGCDGVIKVFINKLNSQNIKKEYF